MYHLFIMHFINCGQKLPASSQNGTNNKKHHKVLGQISVFPLKSTTSVSIPSALAWKCGCTTSYLHFACGCSVISKSVVANSDRGKKTKTKQKRMTCSDPSVPLHTSSPPSASIPPSLHCWKTLLPPTSSSSSANARLRSLHSREGNRFLSSTATRSPPAFHFHPARSSLPPTQIKETIHYCPPSSLVISLPPHHFPVSAAARRRWVMAELSAGSCWEPSAHPVRCSGSDKLSFCIVYTGCVAYDSSWTNTEFPPSRPVEVRLDLVD